MVSIISPDDVATLTAQAEQTAAHLEAAELTAWSLRTRLQGLASIASGLATLGDGTPAFTLSPEAQRVLDHPPVAGKIPDLDAASASALRQVSDALKALA